MSNSLALKNLPAPVRSLLRPMLFAAIGLHALLLFTPMPSEPKPKKPDDKENPVKITQLPTAKVAARPKLAKPALPKIDRPKPAVNVPPAPKPPEKSTTSDAGKKNETATKDPLADFPHYPGAEPNCYGKTDLGENCRVAGIPFTSLVSYFEKALRDKKFTSVATGGDGIKVKIFQVSKNGSTMKPFLSILKDGEGKTAYVLLSAPINSLEELQKTKAPPGELSDILSQVSPPKTTDDPSGGGSGSDDIIPNDFQKPNDFYTDLGKAEQNPDILNSPKIVDGKLADQVYTDLKTYLESSGISSKLVENYGGGPLYEIAKGGFTYYLNLVPNKKGDGTIVVVWTKDPR